MNGGLFLVPGAGIEPARWIPPRDFKSLASTNSATQAQNSGELQVRHSQASTPCTDKHPNCQDWTAWAYLVIRIRICGHFLKSNGLPLNSMSRNHIGFDQMAIFGWALVRFLSENETQMEGNGR
jgi:hypothetical protein